MSDQFNQSTARPVCNERGRTPDPTATPGPKRPPVPQHATLLRVSALSVAGIVSALMITAVAPPIMADQSDRAVVNAPVTLLTAPISGEVEQLLAAPGSDVGTGDKLAQISNTRLDRGTLITLQQRSADGREKLDATRSKKESDRAYIASLDVEIANQVEHLKAHIESQIEELRARVAQSNAQSGEKKALVDRQNSMVARDVASMDMVRPTSQQYSAALHNTTAETAKLNQKLAQLAALNKGIYVGDDLVTINNLAQKRRDIDLDARRMEIEEKELSGVVADLQHLSNAEQQRLERLAAAAVHSTGTGKVLTVEAALGRHVSAGDTIASVVDCSKTFVVAIFSYRQGQNMKVGTHVRIDGGAFSSGLVTAVLPKTSDKADERFAVPFPQTERRELYAVITPEDRDDAAQQATPSPLMAQDPACTVGQWVTVTRDNGVVPSMSVAWRRLGQFVASWLPDGTRTSETELSPASEAAVRRAGMDRLKTAFRSASPQSQSLNAEEDWLPLARGVASR